MNGKYEVTVWTKERNDWLFLHGSDGQDELYREFCKAFPEVHTTKVGVANQRSRIGACTRKSKHGSTKARPLYSEQIKKGYVRIKVAQPSTWISKAKWVWLETHPDQLDTVQETDAFYFLDGDNRNFARDNIVKVERKIQSVLMQMGGIVKGQPELTMLNIARARLKSATLDAGERIGEVVNYNNSRLFRSEVNRRRKEAEKKFREEDPEGYKERNRQRWIKRKAKLTEAERDKIRAYQREWARKKRLKKGNSATKKNIINTGVEK